MTLSRSPRNCSRQNWPARSAPRLQRDDVPGFSRTVGACCCCTAAPRTRDRASSRPSPAFPRPGPPGHRAVRPFRSRSDSGAGSTIQTCWPGQFRRDPALAESARLRRFLAGCSRNVTDALPNCSRALTGPTFRTCLLSLLQPRLLKELVDAHGLSVCSGGGWYRRIGGNRPRRRQPGRFGPVVPISQSPRSDRPQVRSWASRTRSSSPSARLSPTGRPQSAPCT